MRLSASRRRLFIAAALAVAAAVGVGLFASSRRAGPPTEEELCREGELTRCHASALRLQHGLKASKDPRRALGLFEIACDRGHAESCTAAGTLLSRALSRAPEGRARLTRACELGSRRGCHRLGLLWAKGEGGAQDAARAAEFARRACAEELPPEERYGDGCYELGLQHEAGRGVTRDEARALELWRAGCDAKLSSDAACAELGVRYLYGRSVPADPSRATSLLEKACTKKHAGACYELGRAYFEGAGVPSDAKKAEELFDEACLRGDKRGCVELQAKSE